jgi:hypothetical protein
MEQHIERWKHIITDNSRVADKLERGEMHVFTGPTRDAGADWSAALAARLRGINAELQSLIDKYEKGEK